MALNCLTKISSVTIVAEDIFEATIGRPNISLATIVGRDLRTRFHTVCRHRQTPRRCLPRTVRQGRTGSGAIFCATVKRGNVRRSVAGTFDVPRATFVLAPPTPARKTGILLPSSPPIFCNSRSVNLIDLRLLIS